MFGKISTEFEALALFICRELRVSELRDGMPDLLYRRSGLNIESPVVVGAGRGPCYVPERTGNDAYDSDYDFG